MPIELSGEHTTAEVMVDDESLVEESALEQIQRLVDHEAFTEPVTVMPDTHWGAGAPIGFTMPLPDRVVPNIVGVDVGCFTGDTKVDLPDGDGHSIEALAQRTEPFVVYACTRDGEIQPAKATATKTREDAPLVEVEIDNDKTVRCTPDHEFMLRDGTYREAAGLSQGDSLMPRYEGETDDGYTLLYHNRQDTAAQRSVREHWLVARSGDVFDNPALEFRQQIKHHTDETESDIPPQYSKRPDNHEVVAVRELSYTEDVYCLQVPEYHNFALSAGIFVHNCGMAATNLGPDRPLADAERERRVREAVPMGRSVHDYDDAPHLVNEFPFERANEVFERFDRAYRERFGRPVDPLEFEFDGYDGAYFKSLCDRVLARKRQGIGHVIRSAGTLGGGNHFVEFARARESGDYWLVIHSGSRYLGLAVAEYWQERATNLRDADAIRAAIPEDLGRFLKFDPETVSDADLYAWVTGGKGESHIRKEAVREAFEGSEIEAAFERLSSIEPDPDDRNTDLDYLDGREAHGYYVDMLFAQQYARWNRELMSDAICAALGVDAVDRFQSIHNYVDFEDLTIRKGATPAREGQRLVIPFNMAEGSVLARGRGNPEWNETAPHGAGRRMSRREASDRATVEDLAAEMDGVYSESIVESVLDEAPMAYKDADRIAAALEPTAEVVDWLDPVHNLKATE